MVYVDITGKREKQSKEEGEQYNVLSLYTTQMNYVFISMYYGMDLLINDITVHCQFLFSESIKASIKAICIPF